MSVSTKVPASRAGGTGPAGPMAGPIPAPRVVGNRRLRTGGIALAVMLLALGAALSAIALVSASRTASYLVVAKEIPYGEIITADALTTTQLSGGAGLQAIPAAQIALVVGRKRAAATLEPGSLLVVGDLTDKPPLQPGDAQVGLQLGAAQLPARDLRAGDQITLIVMGNGPDAGTDYQATIIDIIHRPDGGALMDISVPAPNALHVVQAIASGVAVILKAKD